MSKGLQIIYLSNINSKEWSTLNDLCRDKLLNKDDITLIRVYMILLGIKPVHGDMEMQEQVVRLISENKSKLNSVFNPELHFTFGPQTLTAVGHLLQHFSLESYIINYSRHQI